MTFEKPAEPTKLAAGLANLHRESRSPTGKFGFHLSTCHAKIPQAVDSWEESWCDLYAKHFRRVIEIASPIIGRRDFDRLSNLVLESVVPRLLLPLQDHGRVLKPCLVHGNCWDGKGLFNEMAFLNANCIGNTAMDTKTGEAFVFDLCSFYGHNEYDTGHWRAPRHRLSNKAFITAYKRRYPVSEPEREWDWRNLLYSLTFNIGDAIHIPGSNQKEVVIADMRTLCLEFCPEDIPPELSGSKDGLQTANDIYQGSADTDDEEEEDRDSEAGSMSASRHLTKPRFLGYDFKSMAEALGDERTGEMHPPDEALGTDIFDAS